MKATLSTIAGFAIVLAWLAALTAGIITKDYQGLIAVTPIMAILAGYLFGEGILSRRINGK